VFLRSKVKRSEWSNFGVERLLGAANGDEPKRGIHVAIQGLDGVVINVEVTAKKVRAQLPVTGGCALLN
jgi:hypothetical protein